MRKRRPFTLVEVVVVIVIMVVAGSVAVSAINSDSTSRLIKRTSWDFRSFCSRVRYKALESGEDRLIVYNPQDTTFYMALPVSDQDAASYDEPFELSQSVKWKLPSEFELTSDDNNPLEVFRFFPDGGASGQRKLNLSCTGKSKVMVIEIASLTGSVVSYERGENDYDEAK